MKNAFTNYDSEVLPDLLNVLTRIEEIESQTGTIKNSMEIKELNWSSNATQFKREMYQNRRHIKELHERVKNIKLDFVNVVNIFRGKATVEDFDKLKKIIDDWPVQNFITKHEFYREVNQIKLEKSKLRRF